MARQAREDERGKRRLEAIAAVLGAVLALGTIGVIVWDGFSSSGRPPVIVVQPLGAQASDGGYVLEISVTNAGGEAAAAVVVEGTLSRNGEVVETSDTTFDYVAEASHRRGGLFFSEDPRTLDVSVRAKGFVDP
jgi:uncharacterized protein (TIGR02588 family)